VFAKTALTLLLVLLAFTPLSAFAEAQQGFGVERELVYTAKLYLLAVRDNREGEVVEVDLKIYYPGSGNVHTSGAGFIAEDTLRSFKYSLILASTLTGVNYEKYDYELTLSRGVRLQGPSATLEFFLVLASFYTNASRVELSSATGLVAPTGIVGSVEGLELKYSAGVGSGLEKIIGPPAKSLENAPKYRGVVDVFDAYREYTGLQLYNASWSSEALAAWRESAIVVSRVFKRSYEFFVNQSTSIIQELEKLNQTSIEELSGYGEYKLALKYAENSSWYTAATYAFRSYIDLYTNYVKILVESGDGSAERIVSELGERAERELSRVKSVISNYTRRVRDLWDLDVVVNSYERLRIALKAYVAGRSSAEIDDRAYYYILAIARAYTAEHWLDLMRERDVWSTGFSRREFAYATEWVVKLVNASFEYYVALGLLSKDSAEKYAANTTAIEGYELEAFVNAAALYSELALAVHSPEIPVFTLYTEPVFIKQLNETVSLITAYLYSRAGVLPPSSLTLAELAENYLVEGVNLSIIGYLYASQLSNLIPYIALVHADALRGSRLEAVTVTRVLAVSPPLTAFYAVLVATASLGAFLTGFSVGRVVGKPGERAPAEVESKTS